MACFFMGLLCVGVELKQAGFIFVLFLVSVVRGTYIYLREFVGGTFVFFLRGSSILEAG